MHHRCAFARIILVVVFAAATRPAAAQTPCANTDSLTFRTVDLAGETAELARLTELDGGSALHSFMLRRTSTAYTSVACAQGSDLRSLAAHAATRTDGRLTLTPIQLRNAYNTGYAVDQNNGALWEGRGLSSALTGGVRLKYGILSAAFAPTIAYQQNRLFETAVVFDSARSEFANAWQRGIDYPQRFGPDAFWTLDPGQSYIRADYAGVGFGFSTENLWWGPARVNPIIMSNTAAGVPHIFLESSRPLNVGIGNAEFMILAGRLDESRYFDFDPDNDVRFLSGIAAVLEPRGLEGLFLGGSRVEHRAVKPGDLGLGELIFGPFRDVRENQVDDNQLLSLFFRWAGSESRLEVYGEWAREDHWGTKELFVQAPDASQAYTIGLQKVVRIGGNRLRLGAETTHLEDALPILHAGRGVLSFYTHSKVIQGHTQRGQLLGAAIGPGSESQTVNADLFWKHGRTGLELERTRYDDDTYHAVWSVHYGPSAHDVEVSATVTHTLPAGPFLLDGALGYSHRYNRSFIGLDGTSPAYTRDSNWSFDVTATFNPFLTLF
ncbi:MAG TPA: hypothetical protein VF035_03500 [Longimicrobiales bacterium]